MSKPTYIVGAAVAVALIAAYVIITVTGNDGTGLLGALLGWLAGFSTPAAGAAVAKANGSGS